MKGALGVVAAEVSSSLAQQVEAAAKQGDLAGAQQSCSKLAMEFKRLTDALCKEFGLSAAQQSRQTAG